MVNLRMFCCGRSAGKSNLLLEDEEIDVSRRKPIIYLIRHGEKPPKDKHGDDPPGLSETGLRRASALVNIFGKDSKYDIGLIMAQRPQGGDWQADDTHYNDKHCYVEYYDDEFHDDKHHKSKHHHKHDDSSDDSDDDGQDDLSQDRPWKTVEPLAQSLVPYGCEVDNSIDRDKISQVKKRIDKFKGPGNVLICWEHHRLTDIARELGVKRKHHHKSYPRYPSSRFDIIWTLEYPYKKISNCVSELVPEIDDHWKGKRVPWPK